MSTEKFAKHYETSYQYRHLYQMGCDCK